MAIKNMERRLFLRGGKAPVIRPPWSLGEDHFLDTCSRCGECLHVCPQKILESDIYNYPKVNFNLGECTFCGECVRICPDQAMVIKSGGAPWSMKALVRQTCLSLKGTVCRSCSEHCQMMAISFRLVAGGRSQPLINAEKCSGCGACYAVCPVGAIRIEEKKERS